jgi:isopentenyl-diphosphate delta-isomerase
VADPRALADKLNGMVRLSPPLPYQSAFLGHGTIDSISTNHLLATRTGGSYNQTGCPPLSSLQLRLGETQSIDLTVTSEKLESGQLLLRADGPDSHQSLHEVLNHVRKFQHIEICRTQDVEASDRYTGFERFAMQPCALPELNFDSIDTSQEFLGNRFGMPVLITGMTGGVELGETINRRLALAASRFKIPMGVGSQRIALELEDFQHIFKVKQFAPDVFLIGNIGLAQITSSTALDNCRRAVDMIRADALAIHLNCLQELIQEEGDRNFVGALGKIASLTKSLDVPIIVKEVGVGVDVATARRLYEVGVAAIDIGGSGGTSWARIEGQRSASQRTMELGEEFRNWGIPTAHALIAIRRELGPTPQIIATGGIRNGSTVAKAVGLGANMAGIGLPLMRAAVQSDEAVMDLMTKIQSALKIAMMCSGCATLSQIPQRMITQWREQNFGADRV